MCWLTVPETFISEARAATGVNGITENGRSRRIWTGLRLAHQLINRLAVSIRTRVLLHDRNSSATIMRASKVPSVLRIFNVRVGGGGADVIAEAIRLTMYHRKLIHYENIDAT